jgi:hypothetical protein
MNKTLLAIVITVVILVVVALIYYFLIYLPSKTQVTSQAFTVTSVPTTYSTTTAISPPQIIGVPFYVSSGSALAQYAYQPLTVVQGPIFVGDSAWLIIEIPTGNYVAEVINTVAAEKMGVGTVIEPGTTITPIVV